MEQLYAAYIIENTLKTLEKFSNGLNEKSDIKKTKTRIINDFKTIELMTKELLIILNNFGGAGSASRYEIDTLNTMVRQETSKVRYAQDIETIINSTNRILLNMRHIGWNYDMRSTKVVIDELTQGVRTNHDNMTVSDANKIINNIHINREFNIFSPRAFDGNTLFKLRQSSKDKAITYGLEKRDNYHTNAKQIVNRMIKGQLQGSTISNQVFDIMQITAPVSWTAKIGQTGNLIEKQEKSTIRNTIKYLRQDGILIYAMPITRMTRDMAVVISKLLRDVQILRKEQDNYYVYIIGVKDIQSEPREEVYKLLMDVEVNAKFNLDIEYNLPSGGIKQPEYFRGSVLDEEELISLVKNSGLKNSFWKSQEIKKDDDSIRPLLPFNMGQIGLVLTSGCLDGTVEEFPGQYHAIKGMVTKIRNVEDTREGQNETSIETISNKVIINLLTPNGDFIELA